MSDIHLTNILILLAFVSNYFWVARLDQDIKDIKAHLNNQQQEQGE